QPGRGLPAPAHHAADQPQGGTQTMSAVTQDVRQVPPPPPPPSTEGPPETYLNVSHEVLSWLLTKDHKRIALLYLVTVTLLFFLRGVTTPIVRLTWLVRGGGLGPADPYTRLFTAHGVIMVFFFLVPVVPTVLGNFCLPMMIGAKDLAFPRL